MNSPSTTIEGTVVCSHYEIPLVRCQYMKGHKIMVKILVWQIEEMDRSYGDLSGRPKVSAVCSIHVKPLLKIETLHRRHAIKENQTIRCY